MFPSVAFRPVRLLIVCVVLTGLAVAAPLLYAAPPLRRRLLRCRSRLGLLNALLVRRAVESITAEDHPLKKKMALNSTTRLLVITVVATDDRVRLQDTDGLGVLFGLAIFQAAAGDEHQPSRC